MSSTIVRPPRPRRRAERCGARGRGREARQRSRRASRPAASPAAAAASALWTASRPSAGIAAPALPGRRHEAEAHARRSPADSTSLGRHVGAGREAVGHDRARASAPPCARTRGSSALRIATPPSARRQRLDQLGLGVLDRLDATRSATGGPAGPRSRSRSTAGRSRPGRGSRRPTYMPISRTARLVLGPEAQDA